MLHRCCCFFYITEIGQFQKIVGGLIEMVDELAKEAEKEKMKVRIFISDARVHYELHELDVLCIIWQAIGARNLLKSVAKQREAQQQQLQALIAEKRMQLERCTDAYYGLSLFLVPNVVARQHTYLLYAHRTPL